MLKAFFSLLLLLSSAVQYEPPFIAEPEPITLCLVGDVALCEDFANAIDAYGIEYPFSRIAHITSRADMAIANLETSVSDKGEAKKEAGYAFRSPADKLSAMTYAGFDAVSLANNHIGDFGDEALADTLANLDSYGILHSGAGNNIDEAEKAAYYTSDDGQIIAMLSFSQRLPWAAWAADKDRPGVAPFYKNNYSKVLENISRTKENCDLLVVAIHWGTEYSYNTEEWQIIAAHAMIDAGADVIFGHHPHLLQPIEIYNGKPIIYSAGNFLFFKRDDYAGESAVFEIIMDGGTLKEMNIYPTFTSGCTVRLLESENERYTRIVNILSANEKGTNINYEVHGS